MPHNCSGGAIRELVQTYPLVAGALIGCVSWVFLSLGFAALSLFAIAIAPALDGVQPTWLAVGVMAAPVAFWMAFAAWSLGKLSALPDRMWASTAIRSAEASLYRIGWIAGLGLGVVIMLAGLVWIFG